MSPHCFLLKKNLSAAHISGGRGRENGMVINTDKTKVMLITSRQKRNNLKNSDLSLNEKVLGVHINENLPWNGHFQYISKKISSHLWLLSQIKSFFIKRG